MKKVFSILSVFVLGMVALSSCNSDDKESGDVKGNGDTNFDITVTDDKKFLEDTGKEFVGMFTAEQAAPYTSIINAIKDSETNDVGEEIDDIIDGLTAKTESPNLTVYKYAIKASAFRGRYVMRNGFLYRSESNTNYPYGEDLVIWKDGSFEITEEGAFTAEELEEQGAYQIFSFGPALVNHGEIKVVEDEEVERAQITNPRTAIGMVEPLHYIMVVSDGRTEESIGLSLYELGELMQRLGCDCAYNLDGGGSSTMWFNGEVLNKPTTYGDVIAERPISDIIYIGYPDDQE